MSSARFYIGLFLVTFSTLMLQLIQTRVLSVVLWYHLAFFVISIAMFGLTAGAVWVYLAGDRFTTETLPRDLGYYTAALAATIALTFVAQMTLTPTFQYSLTFVVVWAELALLISAPFFFAGVVVSLALTRSPFPIGRVYGVDMLGAAAGCLGALVLLGLTDGPSAILWVAATAALGAVFFAGGGSGPALAKDAPVRSVLTRPRTLFLVLAACALVNGATRYGIQPLFVKDRAERRDSKLLFEEWNSFSRVIAVEARGQNLLFGPSPKLPRQKDLRLRVLSIDGSASTAMYRFSGDTRDVGFLKYDVTNLAYYLPNRRRAAVIGVGGGRDVLSALVFGLRDVTGVEINPIFIKLLTRDPDFSGFAGLRDLEGVRFIVDEARSWFARSREQFDVIQMSMIDTWAATGAGAFTLSENGLYTTEAWDVFLQRLLPNGVFTVSRWYAPGEVNETGRMISLAVATLMKRGVAEPRRHLFVASRSSVATLLLSPSPFSAADLEALENAVADLGYQTQLSPNVEPASDVLRRIVTARELTQLRESTADLDLDLSPPTDDKPFFFNQLPFYRPSRILRMARGERPRGVIAGNLQAATTLLVILVVSVGLVLATIVLPLRSAIRDTGKRLILGGTAYFLLIGIGFMTVEIGLLQRMSVFLGHPIYSLGVVLFGIILATGMGSLASDRAVLDDRPRFVAWSAVTGIYLLTLPFWWSPLSLAFDSARLWVRIALCMGAILPAGFAMGFGFPSGMRMIAAIDNRPTPWLWGVNGAAGVVGGTLGLAISIAFGISVTIALGGVCYLLLLVPVLGARLLPRQPAAVHQPSAR